MITCCAITGSRAPTVPSFGGSCGLGAVCLPPADGGSLSLCISSCSATFRRANAGNADGCKGDYDVAKNSTFKGPIRLAAGTSDRRSDLRRSACGSAGCGRWWSGRRPHFGRNFVSHSCTVGPVGVPHQTALPASRRAWRLQAKLLNFLQGGARGGEKTFSKVVSNKNPCKSLLKGFNISASISVFIL